MARIRLQPPVSVQSCLAQNKIPLQTSAINIEWYISLM